MENKSVCKNPWCKAHYSYEGDNPPGQCPKCISFDQDLSGGVSWITKHYSEPRDDGRPHEIMINIDGSSKNSYSGGGRPLLGLIKKFLGK